jgi:hypothetical protein
VIHSSGRTGNAVGTALLLELVVDPRTGGTEGGVVVVAVTMVVVATVTVAMLVVTTGTVAMVVVTVVEVTMVVVATAGTLFVIAAILMASCRYRSCIDHWHHQQRQRPALLL